MGERFTDAILDEAGLKELRKARQKNTIHALVGTAALMDHTSREQEVKSITETYINSLKGSLESLSSNLGRTSGEKGKTGIKATNFKNSSLLGIVDSTANFIVH